MVIPLTQNILKRLLSSLLKYEDIVQSSCEGDFDGSSPFVVGGWGQPLLTAALGGPPWSTNHRLGPGSHPPDRNGASKSRRSLRRLVNLPPQALRAKLSYYVVAHFHYVLSLGAVVSLVAGFYYWVGKISGYHYSEKWGYIHLITFTFAVNLVFMPMHFLGLNGFPRRYPDFADGHVGWNSFITIGSILTFLSLVIFITLIAFTVFNPRTNDINNKFITRWVA